MKNIIRLVSLVLVIGGVALLLYGLITNSDLQESIGNTIANAIAGKTDKEKQAIGMAIGGGALIVIGIGLFLLGGKSPKKRR